MSLLPRLISYILWKLQVRKFIDGVCIQGVTRSSIAQMPSHIAHHVKASQVRNHNCAVPTLLALHVPVYGLDSVYSDESHCV